MSDLHDHSKLDDSDRCVLLFSLIQARPTWAMHEHKSNAAAVHIASARQQLADLKADLGVTDEAQFVLDMMASPMRPA
jgi:hypothetical protein